MTANGAEVRVLRKNTSVVSKKVFVLVAISIVFAAKRERKARGLVSLALGIWFHSSPAISKALSLSTPASTRLFTERARP